MPRCGQQRQVRPLAFQALGTAAFIVLGQAGDTVKTAYELLVGMAVIVYFLPYLVMFAALIRIQREPAGPDVRRVPRPILSLPAKHWRHHPHGGPGGLMKKHGGWRS